MRATLGTSALLLALGCGDGVTTSQPRPSVPPTLPSSPGPISPGASVGPTQIAFVSASEVPGSTLGGCGPAINGCAGRLRMVFSLRSPTGGPALYFRAFLHSTQRIACLTGSTGAFTLPAGQSEVAVVFDQADACATPVSIANLAAVVEGTVEVASRQEWGLSYTFAP